MQYRSCDNQEKIITLCVESRVYTIITNTTHTHTHTHTHYMHVYVHVLLFYTIIENAPDCNY